MVFSVTGLELSLMEASLFCAPSCSLTFRDNHFGLMDESPPRGSAVQSLQKVCWRESPK